MNKKYTIISVLIVAIVAGTFLFLGKDTSHLLSSAVATDNPTIELTGIKIWQKNTQSWAIPDNKYSFTMGSSDVGLFAYTSTHANNVKIVQESSGDGCDDFINTHKKDYSGVLKDYNYKMRAGGVLNTTTFQIPNFPDKPSNCILKHTINIIGIYSATGASASTTLVVTEK